MLIAVVVFLLIFVLSLAVDVGRVRLAKVQLQNAADAATTAGASGLQFLPQGVIEPQDRAYEAAARNFSIDQKSSGAGGGREDRPVELVVDEDVEFGIWRHQTRTFERLEQRNGGIDERRQANAVRVWGRRVTSFEDGNGNTVQRGTGLPLIFASVLPDGPLTGEIQANATAALIGGRTGYGFVGLEWVKLNGTTGTDSYNSATETYPGVDGPNQLGTIASNGDIELVGSTTVRGDVHPGVDGNITPNPLGGNVVVTGYMDPLDEPLDYPLPPWNPPPLGSANPPNHGQIVPATALSDQTLAFAPKNTNATIKTGTYLFSSFTAGPQDEVVLDNTDGPITLWVDGNVRGQAQVGVKILTDSHPVTFNVNGNFDMQGGGIFNEATNLDSDPPYIARPENLIINMCKAGTSLDIGGSPTTSAHIYAPGSDVKVHGNADGDFGYWGWIIGNSLFVTGGSELHYDETRDSTVVPFQVRLVD